ncbi:hypothetical protein GGI25_002643 [Coemansia spiralis]|uniref:DNL-type domain-containing protein n=1 Tax=Coemansia spiralis TaxID=417178 RepID=A0A9W8KXB4_9FUNG|nr:hypothetical protein GGI25_002643 [Coemansia spiralis]
MRGSIYIRMSHPASCAATITKCNLLQRAANLSLSRYCHPSALLPDRRGLISAVRFNLQAYGHLVLPFIAKRHKTTDAQPEQPESLKDDRMLIGFTCKTCNHRQYKTMSKRAYQHGVVLIQCDECKNRHLIADNLGWFRDKNVNIQDLMKEKGEEVRQLKDMDLLDGVEASQIKAALAYYDEILAKRNKEE